jgi:hypothetical protein
LEEKHKEKKLINAVKISDQVIVMADLRTTYLSSAVMDSPLWGVMRISHEELLWHQVGDDCYAKTNSLSEWIVYYYYPFGHCQVWKDPWPWPGMPTSEAVNKEFSLKNIILNRRWPLQVHKMITNL